MEMNATSGGSEDHHGNYKPRLENRDEERAQQHTGEDKEERKPPAMAKKTWGDMMKELKVFLWNPETRECLGRTAHSWGRIFLFYLVFYLFLAGMFAACLYGLVLTLSPYTPKYRDRVSPPGVMIRPHVKHGFSISLNMSDPKSWQPYVENLQQFLEAYNDSVQESKNTVCTPGNYFIQDTGESTMKHACQFKRSLLKNCSGLEDETFGYSLGHPCILLKINRIIGYRPGYGTPVTVECKAQKGNESDIQAVDFYPNTTFDPMYFPYYGKSTHVNYTSPLVAIQFTVIKNQLIPIQCQLNGVGIINDKHNDRFLGRIIFSLSVTE
ncbi:protein ATP1B4 [Eublepharis macularius]|uniref:Sodium/potassium-transporting ATPase subunit beta n=1 Tax=Eublepharis macularius TaxID=481883 RepID=A0AA97KD15_EUBMA|nr:protein ATP1B4 [Eublepharis macularius]XP_054852714.1 protein ATP1B4 [Eublepharis macularius]XP_054852715.1 protein ATP1B4 [Eublepharis macularius]XP_054852716.1 protein ATP1B4 [Eublepharis macularius]